MSDKLSRRDFLKLGGAGLAGLFLHRQTKETEKIALEIEQQRTFETEKAIYLPVFEVHTRRYSDVEVLAAKPDCLFVEFVSKTDGVLNKDPLKILKAESFVSGGVGEEIIETGKFISEELLEGLSKQGVAVSIEGLDLPDILMERAGNINKVTGTLPGISIVASLGVALSHLAKEKRYTKGDYTRIYASVLASLWANSDEFGIATVRSFYDRDEQTQKIKNAQNVANRIYAAVSFAHPEDVIVFMRNIFMASKLITLGDELKSDLNEKTKIAFRLGAAHGAVSDLVKMGKTICHTMLNVYPDNTLRQVVEFNTNENKSFSERIEDFCTTIVIPVDEALNNNSGTKYIVDSELKNYLLKRLSDKNEE